MTLARILEIAQRRGLDEALKVAKLCQEQHLIDTVRELIEAQNKGKLVQAGRKAGLVRPVLVFKLVRGRAQKHVGFVEGHFATARRQGIGTLAHLPMMRPFQCPPMPAPEVFAEALG